MNSVLRRTLQRGRLACLTLGVVASSFPRGLLAQDTIRPVVGVEVGRQWNGTGATARTGPIFGLVLGLPRRGFDLGLEFVDLGSTDTSYTFESPVFGEETVKLKGRDLMVSLSLRWNRLARSAGGWRAGLVPSVGVAMRYIESNSNGYDSTGTLVSPYEARSRTWGARGELLLQGERRIWGRSRVGLAFGPMGVATLGRSKGDGEGMTASLNRSWVLRGRITF